MRARVLDPNPDVPKENAVRVEFTLYTWEVAHMVLGLLEAEKRLMRNAKRRKAGPRAEDAATLVHLAGAREVLTKVVREGKERAKELRYLEAWELYKKYANYSIVGEKLNVTPAVAKAMAEIGRKQKDKGMVKKEVIGHAER